MISRNLLRAASKQSYISHQIGEQSYVYARARRISTTCAIYANSKGRQGTNNAKNDVSASSQTSTSSSTTSSSSSADTSAAVRAYAASARGKSVSPPPSAIPKQQPKGSEEGKSGSDSPKVDSPTPKLEGGAQKMFRKEAVNPDNPTSSPKANGSATSKESPIQPEEIPSNPTQSSEKNEQINLAEGVIISSNGNHTRTGQSQGFFPPANNALNRQNSSGSQDTQDDGGSGGPPAMTESSAESNEKPPRHLFLYPFNTHAFIKRLQEAGFMTAYRVEPKEGTPPNQAETALSANKRHDPAEAIMESLHQSLVTRGQEVVDSHMNKTEGENQAYLFTAALAELRTELQVRARNDAAALRSMVTLLQREVDSLNQRMREDVASMKHDIQVDMNNRKSEAKEEQNTLDQEIQDLNNRFTISISDLKTEIEQSIKWDATRRALTIFFGCIVILIATLAAADYLTRDEVEANDRNGKAGQAGKEQPEIKSKTPEELGLVATYDDEHGNRYV
ncbi:hypothetical protein L7F22_039141 [Adiantum nelumboides]|nr:hypothetical protein [Adiantum nelumboides]